MNRLRFRVLAVLATLGIAGVVVAAQPAGAVERAARHVLLQLLGLNPKPLQAVQIEGTKVLPNL